MTDTATRDTAAAKGERSLGIYVKTYRPDHYLARVLIASLRHFAPGVEVTLVPDDGFRHATLWGEPVLHVDDPFLRSLRGYYKKLWVFFGPYERFIYLDADVLALRPLEPLVERVRDAGGPFFVACAESKTVRRLAECDGAERREIVTRHVGDVDLMAEFDPAFDWKTIFPFNSGFFASHRDAVPYERLKAVFTAAQELHRQRGLPPLATSREGLFVADQGLINYLVYTGDVKPEFLEDVFVWGGRPLDVGERTGSPVPPGDPPHPGPLPPREREAGRFRQMFVHWAGCPRPTFLRRGVPAGDRWIEFYYQHYQRRRSRLALLLDTGANIISDLWSRARRTAGSIKRRWRRGSRSRTL